MMTYRRGDVVKVLVPRLDPPHGDKERYAVVLSERAHNNSNDYGIFVAISSGAPTERLGGTYQIVDLTQAGLHQPSVVVPWLWTLAWSVVIEKRGELPPFEFKQMIERLREVVTI